MLLLLYIYLLIDGFNTVVVVRCVGRTAFSFWFLNMSVYLDIRHSGFANKYYSVRIQIRLTFDGLEECL
jgi:hypothetical protein